MKKIGTSINKYSSFPLENAKLQIVMKKDRAGLCSKHAEEWNIESHYVGKKKLKFYW